MRKLSKKALLKIEAEATAEISAYNRLMRQDANGQYEWSVEERAEIDKLAEAIKENRTVPRFGGPASIGDISRKEHMADARTIASWEDGGFVSPHGRRVCAEMRRRRAARKFAFQLAGQNL